MKSTPGGGTTFELELQAFATAFQNGDWLLLDEMNLAQDTVLQCIEQALDSGQLVVNDLSGGEGAVDGGAPRDSKRTIKMNANFRLFATQNPNTGLFKGKREQLSQSLLSRFLPVTFNELPTIEWERIVQKKLQLQEADTLEDVIMDVAKMLVAFHTALSKLHDTGRGEMGESELMRQLQRTEETKAPYAVFSIRDLLQVKRQHHLRPVPTFVLGVACDVLTARS
jgi:midasin (ATPase involved in ribosome maturation)